MSGWALRYFTQPICTEVTSVDLYGVSVNSESFRELTQTPYSSRPPFTRRPAQQAQRRIFRQTSARICDDSDCRAGPAHDRLHESRARARLRSVAAAWLRQDRKSTRLNSSHTVISYA